MIDVKALIEEIDLQLWGPCRSVTWDHPNEVHRMRDLLTKAKEALEAASRQEEGR